MTWTHGNPFSCHSPQLQCLYCVWTMKVLLNEAQQANKTMAEAQQAEAQSKRMKYTTTSRSTIKVNEAEAHQANETMAEAKQVEAQSKRTKRTTTVERRTKPSKRNIKIIT